MFIEQRITNMMKSHLVEMPIKAIIIIVIIIIIIIIIIIFIIYNEEQRNHSKNHVCCWISWKFGLILH